MADPIGTAYLRVLPDTSGLNARLGAYFSSSEFSKMGKAAGAALGAGLAAGGAVKGLYEIGQAFDEAYDKIRINTGASGKELAKLQRNFKNVVSAVPADFDAASEAVAGLNQRLGLTGKPLNRLAKQVTELSRITGTDVQTNVKEVTRLFGDWGVRTRDQTETLDSLFRASQETGIKISDLSSLMVQFGSPLRQLGLDFETSAAMFARFEREGVNIQTLMPGLRMALKNFSAPTDELTASFDKLGISLKEGPSAALREVFEALQDAPSDLKANALAFEVFGARAGPDMAAAVREGRFELDDLMDTIRNGRDTIRKAGRETMDFGEQWQVLKNNIFVALEPLAKKVFGAIGDEMKRVTDILTDKDLTSEEKFSAVLDEIQRVAKEWGPEIAEAGGKIGIGLVKGVATAFKESGVLGKLFIGAAALRMFGGAGVFGRLGSSIAAKIAAGMGVKLGSSTVAGKVAGGLTTPGWTPARPLYVSVVGSGLPNGPTPPGGGDKPVPVGAPKSWWDKLKTNAKGAILPVTVAITGAGITDELTTDWFEKMPDGDGLFSVFENLDRSFGVMEKISALEPEGLFNFSEGLDDSAVSAIKLGVELPTTIARARSIGNVALKVAKDARQFDIAFWSARKQLRHTSDDASAFGKDVGRATKSAVRDFKNFEKNTKRTANTVGKSMGDLGGDIGDLAAGADRSFDKVNAKSKGMARAVSRNVVNLSDAVGGGLAAIVANTNKALKGFGVKKIAFAATSAGEAVGEALGAYQTGGAPTGVKVPGHGSGDKVHLEAMVEPGERVFVLNRNASGELERLQRLNDEVPRFQEGGLAFALGPYDIPPIDYASDHAGTNSHVHITGTTTPWIVAIGKKLQQMGFLVGEHPAFGGVQGSHSATGGHYDALAIDVNSAQSLNESREEVAQIARLLGSGVAGGVAERIKRVLLEGPNGMMRDLGQAGLDKAWKAANAFIAKHSASETESGISADGEVEKVFADVAKRLSDSKTATLALGMAGYAESGMRDLPGGLDSSEGALQLLASTAANMGIDPHNEGEIASAFLLEGYYGKGGANKLAAQGLPAHLVAQGVQGSFDSSGSNYAAQEGPAKSWMARFGLQKGGLMERLRKLARGGMVSPNAYPWKVYPPEKQWDAIVPGPPNWVGFASGPPGDPRPSIISSEPSTFMNLRSASFKSSKGGVSTLDGTDIYNLMMVERGKNGWVPSGKHGRKGSYGGEGGVMVGTPVAGWAYGPKFGPLGWKPPKELGWGKGWLAKNPNYRKLLGKNSIAGNGKGVSGGGGPGGGGSGGRVPLRATDGSSASIASLAESILLNADNAAALDPKKDSSKYRSALKKIEKNIGWLGLDPAITKKINRNLTDVELFGDWAGTAAALTTDTKLGTYPPGSSVEDGGEAHWLAEQLTAMLKYRNALIDGIKTAAKRDKQVHRFVKEIEEKIRAAEVLVKKSQDREAKLLKDLEVAERKGKDELAKIKKALEKKLEDAKGSKEKKEIQEQIDALETEGWNKETRQIHRELKDVRERLGLQTDRVGLLKDTVLPKVGDQDTKIETGLEGFRESLVTLQGNRPGEMSPFPPHQIPPLGKFGGDILTNQTDFASAIAQQVGTVDDTLTIAGLREIIEEARFGVYDSRLQKFHTGGVVPGPVGTEVPIMALAGEEVVPIGGNSETEYIGTAYLDLGDGIEQAVEMKFRKRDRAQRQKWRTR